MKYEESSISLLTSFVRLLLIGTGLRRYDAKSRASVLIASGLLVKRTGLVSSVGRGRGRPAAVGRGRGRPACPPQWEGRPVKTHSNPGRKTPCLTSHFNCTAPLWGWWMGSARWERQRAGGERRGAAAGPECGREERRWEEESPFNESK